MSTVNCESESNSLNGNRIAHSLKNWKSSTSGNCKV
jgi:hypothetical protein